jgi:DNA-binding NtrC family response regulator
VYPAGRIHVQDHYTHTQNMPLFDTSIWIVHRDPGPRGALGRLAGAAGGRHEIVLGRPGDSVFDAAAPANVVVLDVSRSLSDPEPELDLARRVQRNNPSCAWILVTQPGSLEATLRLFDTLEAQVIAGPPDARTLQAALASALERARVLPLSQRIGRDYLSARFVRWFSAAEPAELALALDPRLAAEPVLARGEVGTGRGLLLRYVHSTSTDEAGPFVRVACGGSTRPDELIAQIEDGAREAGHLGGRFGIWLDEIDRLTEAVQTRVLDWIEFGLPGVLPSNLRGNVRWFVSAGSDPTRLTARLALAFVELTIRTVPLRERPELIPAFVADTTRAWSLARREDPKTFDPPAIDLLRDEPWPGNLAELEAVVIRTLAHADPNASTIRIADLRFGPDFETSAGVAATAPQTPSEETHTPAPATAPPPASEQEPEPVAILQPELEGEELFHELPEIVELELPLEPGPGIEGTQGPESIARLAKAVAHEVRNPLVSIRTFSELLPEHYADEDFRERFGRLVADDVRRIEAVVERLEQMGESQAPTPDQRIDMTALLEGLLDEQRSRIQAKHLLVLKELDRARPEALGDPVAMRNALAALLDRAVQEVPDRGDLYLASRHQAETPERARMRILLRYRVRSEGQETPSDGDLALETLRETNLGTEVAESIIQRQGGTLSIDTRDPAETLVTIDLPAPLARS